MRILFANIGWMIHYRGYNPKDQIDGGGSYKLCVVTNAIQQPVLTVFIWDSILRAWVSDKDQSLVLSIEERPSYLAEVE